MSFNRQRTDWRRARGDGRPLGRGQVAAVGKFVRLAPGSSPLGAKCSECYSNESRRPRSPHVSRLARGKHVVLRQSHCGSPQYDLHFVRTQPTMHRPSSAPPRRANGCGISFPVRPSRTRPACFLFTPPHCLKKNGTSATWQRSRISRTHAGSIKRAPGPDSPPTITQSIPDRLRSGSGPGRGSRDRNLIRRAGAAYHPLLEKAVRFDTVVIAQG